MRPAVHCSSVNGGGSKAERPLGPDLLRQLLDPLRYPGSNGALAEPRHAKSKGTLRWAQMLGRAIAALDEAMKLSNAVAAQPLASDFC
jgi:hypothetical protein